MQALLPALIQVVFVHCIAKMKQAVLGFSIHASATYVLAEKADRAGIHSSLPQITGQDRIFCSCASIMQAPSTISWPSGLILPHCSKNGSKIKLIFIGAVLADGR
jgi:hypothetical protein